MKRSAWLFSALLLTTSCAPPGYHYGALSLKDPGQAFQLLPNDACRDPRLVSPGAIRTMNSSVGLADGLPKPVVAVSKISSSGDGPPLGYDAGPPPQIQCYETVTFRDGSQQRGKIDVISEKTGMAIIWSPKPRPISSRQRAEGILASERYAAETQACGAVENARMGQLANLTLAAKASGTPFDQGSYVKATEQSYFSCLRSASRRFRGARGSVK